MSFNIHWLSNHNRNPYSFGEKNENKRTKLSSETRPGKGSYFNDFQVN